MWYKCIKRLRDLPLLRKPTSFSSASINAKASKGQCGINRKKKTIELI
jgi:hypothetical protein